MIKEADIKKYKERAKAFKASLAVNDDEMQTTIWGLIWNEISKKYPVLEGSVLKELVFYAAENNISVSDVANALEALHIEVERG